VTNFFEEPDISLAEPGWCRRLMLILLLSVMFTMCQREVYLI